MALVKQINETVLRYRATVVANRGVLVAPVNGITHLAEQFFKYRLVRPW